VRHGQLTHTLQKPAMAMAFIVLGLATLAAFWHWELGAGFIDWHQGFSSAKRGFPGSFEPQTERWWEHGSRGAHDNSQTPDTVSQPRNRGFASEQGTSAVAMLGVTGDEGENEAARY